MYQNPEQMHDSTVKAPVENTVEAPVDMSPEGPVDITGEAVVEERNGSEQESIRVVHYQKPLSTAMLDTTSLQNPASENSSQISDTMPDASLEGPFGVGPLVFPSLQRFNNINFFLFTFCILSLAQGKSEDQDCSGKWNRVPDMAGKERG